MKTTLPILKTEDGLRLYDPVKRKTLGTLFTDGFDFVSASDSGDKTVLRFKKGNVELTVTYEQNEGALEETASVFNGGNEPYRSQSFVFGFTSRNPETDLRFCAIPFRYRSEDGEKMDWNAEEYLAKKHVFCTMRNPMYERRETDTECAEGFALYEEDGHTLLCMKYSYETVEWSLLKVDESGLSFGGSGIGKMGDPESGATILPGERYTFGKTRYVLCENGWKEAFYVFRDYTASQGHRPRPDFDPKLNWNELYDNRYWYESNEASHDVKELTEKYYQKADMLYAAEKAYEFGCECLYLDPGWDTAFGSNLWDESRLGDMNAFAAEIREKYGLSLGLHTPLAPWSDPTSYPDDACKTDASGKVGPLCVISDQYFRTKIERMKELVKNGADFFLYDGSWYEKPCYNPHHGHRVPSSRQEHLDAIQKLSQILHAAYPHVIIEQHDGIIGPGCPRYLPLYFKMKPGTGDPDEIWSFEFMNDPLDDFKSGRAYSMYYANLATKLPFYLHIDLRFDNEECLSFWWFASTCRHLGIGGTAPEPEKYQKQKAHVRNYLENKAFYTKGEFFGITELIHAHVLDNEALIDVFNPSECEKTITFTVSAASLGMDLEEEKTLTVAVPKAGHASVKTRFC